MESQAELHAVDQGGTMMTGTLPRFRIGDTGLLIKAEEQGSHKSYVELERTSRPCLRESGDQSEGVRMHRSTLEGPLQPGTSASVELKTISQPEEEALGAALPQSCGQPGLDHPNLITEPQQERLHCEENIALTDPQEQQPPPCSDCGAACQPWQDLAPHQGCHGRVKQHQCTHCGQCFLHASRLSYRTQIPTREQPYSSSQCGKSFSLNEHLHLHMGEEGYHCKECEESGKCKEHLQCHQQMHISEAPFLENAGIVIKVEEPELDEHHKALEQIPGPHRRDSGGQAGKGPLQGPLVSVGQRGELYGASISQRCNEGNMNLVTEPQGTSQARPLCEKSIPVAPQDQPGHTCSDCGKAFQRWQELATHRSSHDRVKQHQCTHCGQRFLHRSRLNYHARIHTGERPYSCSVCGKSYSRKEHLQNHQRLHTGEKPYQCKACGKNYSRREHLQYHQRLHTGERPFQCQVCGKRFIRKQNLLKHQRVHTGERHKVGSASTTRSPSWTAGKHSTHCDKTSLAPSLISQNGCRTSLGPQLKSEGGHHSSTELLTKTPK